MTTFRYQASDGVDISGAGLDSVLGQLQAMHNTLPEGTLSTRYVTNQIVTGWTPGSLGNNQLSPLTPEHKFPWLHSVNCQNDVVDGEGVINLERIKGSYAPGLYPLQGPSGLYDDFQWVNTISFYSKNGCVIDAIDVYFVTDEASGIPSDRQQFVNNFRYGTPAPVGFAANDSTQDIYVGVSIDSPMTPWNQKQSAVAFQKGNFRVRAYRPFNQPAGNPYPQIVPSYDSYGPIWGRFSGIFMAQRNLGIVVPMDSRVRFHVAIPQYNGTVSSSGWGAFPMNTFRYNSTLTFKEPLV